MEEIYRPESFNATEHIQINEYFKTFSDALFDEQKAIRSVEENIATFFKENNVNYDERLSEFCSINLLATPKDFIQFPAGKIGNIQTLNSLFQKRPITEASLSLETVKKLMNRNKNGSNRDNFQQLVSQIPFEIRDAAKSLTELVTGNLKVGEDFLVFVRLFHQFSSYKSIAQPRRMKMDHEICLLSSNTLTDLRDKICCNNDLIAVTDLSADPKQTEVTFIKDEFPSGFLFINDVFYNDFRSKKAIDYSKVIVHWAMEKNLGNFDVKEMKDVKISDLKIRFGQPYLYQHMCRCEHVFIFSYARLIASNDSLDRKDYPYYSGVSQVRGPMCYICEICYPKWIVSHFDKLPVEHCPLCDKCFISICYIKEKKAGDFKAFPYATKIARF